MLCTCFSMHLVHFMTSEKTQHLIVILKLIICKDFPFQCYVYIIVCGLSKFGQCTMHIMKHQHLIVILKLIICKDFPFYVAFPSLVSVLCT